MTDESIAPTGNGTFLEADRLVMASPKQVEKFTGQQVSGVAPVGHPAPLHTIVDETLGHYELIWTSAGTSHVVIPLTFDDLVHLTNGTSTRVKDDEAR